MAAPHPAIRRKGLSSQVAFEQKLVLAPGAVFSVSGNADSCMRFNVAPLTDPQIRDRPDSAMKVPQRLHPIRTPTLTCRLPIHP